MLLKLSIIPVILANLEPLYFDMLGKETRCFLEEMPKETLMTGKYHAKLVTVAAGIITDTPPGLGMLVKVIGPDGKVMLDKVYGSRGKFAFTTHKPGNHKMCLSSNSTQWTVAQGAQGAQRLRVDLSLHIGEDKEYYKRMVKDDKLSELQLNVVKLSDQVSQIQKEQDFQRYREEGFRKISEILNARVLWWAVIQVVLVVVVGIWQTTHMRGFFLKKKIV